jgi:hypothetical protein
MLTSDRITDGEACVGRAVVDKDEESVARGQQIVTVVKTDDGLELVVGGSVIEGEEVFAVSSGVSEFGEDDDGEGWLTIVVGMEEIEGGGGAAPGTANSAAAEEGFRGKTDEDLPDDNLLRDVDKLHDRRRGIQR